MAFWNNHRSTDKDVADLARKVAIVTFGKKYGWICRSKSTKSASNRMIELDKELRKYLELAIRDRSNKTLMKQLDSMYDRYLNGGK